jgi:HSP20 family protein
MNTISERYRRIQVCRRHGLVERQGLYLHRHEIHAMFDELIHRPWGTMRWNPAVDIREDNDTFIIEADLPGVKAEELQILVEGKTVAIEGQRRLGKCDEVTSHLCERPDGHFARVFEFDDEIDETQIESRWEDGVLTVTVPKPRR